MPTKFELELTTKGAKQQHEALGKSAKGAREVGEQTKRAGRKAEQGGRGFGKMLNTVKGLVGAYLGVQGFNAVLRINRAELEEQIRVTKEFVATQKELLAVTQDISDVQEVSRLAVETGIQRGDIATGLGIVRHETISATRAVQDQLLRSALEMNKTIGVQVESAARLGATIYNLTKAAPEVIENLVYETLRAGKGLTAEVLARGVGKAIPAGQELGLSLAKILSLFGAATTVTGAPREAITGVEGILTGLAAPKGEAKDILAGQGLLGKGFAEVLATARLTLEQRELLFQPEGARVFAKLQENREALDKVIRELESVATLERDLGLEKLETLRRELQGFAVLEETERLKRGEEVTDTRAEALYKDLGEQFLRTRAKARGVPALRRAISEWSYDLLTGFGVSPEKALDVASSLSLARFYDYREKFEAEYPRSSYLQAGSHFGRGVGGSWEPAPGQPGITINNGPVHHGGHVVHWHNRDLTKAEDVRRLPGAY